MVSTMDNAYERMILHEILNKKTFFCKGIHLKPNSPRGIVAELQQYNDNAFQKVLEFTGEQAI